MNQLRRISSGLLPILLICVPLLGGARGCSGDSDAPIVEADAGLDMATISDAHVPDAFVPDGFVSDGGTPDAAPDSSMPVEDGGGCGTSCVGVGTCADPIDLAAVAPPDGAGVMHASGTTAGAPSRIFGCQDSAGPELVYRYTPTEDGFVRIDTAGSTDDFHYNVNVYAREACEVNGNDLACADARIADDEIAYMVVRATHGVPIYIVVDSYDSEISGPFLLNVAVLHPVEVGGVCDPTGAENFCATGLVCAGLSGSTTCQPDLDLGCGTGVPVFDISSRVVDGVAQVRGNTLLGTNALVGASCDRDGTATRSSIYKIHMPYAALVDVTAKVRGAFFMPILYTRTSCTSAPSEHGCSGGFDVSEAALPFTSVGPVAAGTDLYFAVDAHLFTIDGEGPTSGGEFDLSVQLTRLIEEGGECTPGGVGDRCTTHTTCTGTPATCQHVDLGCGFDVAVADLNPLIVANSATFYGNIAHYSDGITLSCGGASKPEFVHKITMPFAGTLSVSVDEEFFTFPVVGVRTGSCMGGDLVCRDGDTIESSEVGHLEAGATVYIIVDGEIGDYALNVRLFPG